MNSTLNSQLRCGIILAGGEGQRLRPLVQQLRGEILAKQYINFIGTRSMLEHSFHRAEMVIPKERIFTVVSRAHLNHPRVQRQLAGRAKGTIVSQPENRDTVAGILLPLIYLYRRYPESTVAIFPSDHFIVEERLFMRHVELAFSVVEEDRSRLVLLGIEPTQPETEYGYILPDGEQGGSRSQGPYRVKRFVEKPDRRLAQELIGEGGLWNTMVIVSRTKTLLDLARGATPDLYGGFAEILEAIDTPDERVVLEEVYGRIRPKNFSKGLLEILPLQYPSLLSVLRVRGVFWSDWGLPHYVESVLRRIGGRERVEIRVENPEQLFPMITPRRSLWKTA